MKRLLTFAAIILMLIMTMGCSGLQYESTSRIARPQVKSAPIQGTWLVKDCITRTPGKSQESRGDKLIGMEVSFSNTSIVFGDYKWNDITYKIKRVNTDEYFLHRYNGADDKLAIDENEIYVIQVSSGEKFLYEFAEINEKMISVNIDSNLYCLTKTSDEFSNSSKKIADEEGADIILGKEDKTQELRSGIFLGLRIPQTNSASENGNNFDEYRYQTYWIAFSDGGLRPVLTAPDIFLPRKDGFWRVKSRETTDNSSASDVIYAYRVSSSGSGKQSRVSNPVLIVDDKQTMRKSSILYVGNDFICFEDAYYLMNETQQSAAKKVLRTLPVDSMEDQDGIKLSDIAGQNGTMAFEEAMSDLLKNSKNNAVKSIDYSNTEKNFALFRKTGHWFLKGRINFNKEYPVPFTDFNLNLLPPSDMVAYDTLNVPWTIIKDRIPQATDAYTSPNKDMALVLTRSSLMIYAINGSDISEIPLMQIPISEGSTVVMAEWGTGSYMKNWEKAFVENNSVKDIK